MFAGFRCCLLLTCLCFLGCDLAQFRPEAGAETVDDETFVRLIMADDRDALAATPLEKVNPNAKNKHGDTALIWAAYKGNTALVKALLAKGADPSLPGAGGKTPLHWACEIGAMEAAELLIKAGADVNEADRGGVTPMIAATRNFQGYAVQYLLEHGADPNRADRFGETALMHAVRKGNPELVQTLVLGRASVDPISAAGETALSLAVKRNRRGLFEAPAIQERIPDLKTRFEAKIETVIANADQRPQFDQSLVAEVVKRINVQRLRFGLPELTLDPHLTTVAGKVVADLAKSDGADQTTSAHAFASMKGRYQDLSGEGPGFEIGMNGYRGRIYAGSHGVLDQGVRTIEYDWHDRNGLADQIVTYWTETHDRENILNELTLRTGGSFEVDAGGEIRLVMMFYRGLDQRNLPILEPELRPVFAPDALEQAIHQRMNQARVKAGLKPLAYNQTLAEVAAEHAGDVAERGIFYHITPALNGLDPAAMPAGADHPIHENLLRVPLFSEEEVVVVARHRYRKYTWLELDALADLVAAGLLENEANRANLLNPKFDKHGIGAHWFKGNQSYLYVTQNFFIYEREPERLETVVANAADRPVIDAEALEAEIHRLVNLERKAHKLAPLKYDARVAEVARLHSADMAARGFVDHVNPSGETPMDRVKRFNERTTRKVGITLGIAENIHRGALYTGRTLSVQDGKRLMTYDWIDLAQIATLAVEGWMSSEGHRANILTKDFTKEGIGIHVDEKGHVYVTQNFI